MTVLEVDTSQRLEVYDQQVELDGQVYTLTFRFNRRNNSWYMDIADEDNVHIASGRRCVVNSVLNGQFRYLSTNPPGALTVFDTTGRQAPPELNDFGSRVLLLYFDESEGIS